MRLFIQHETSCIVSHWLRKVQPNNRRPNDHKNSQPVPADLIRMIDQFTHRVFWCYNCFKSSKRCELFYCGACKIAKFCSAQCERKAEYHKATCFNASLPSVRASINQINKMSAAECMKKLQKDNIFRGNPFGALLLKRIRSIIYYNYQRKFEFLCHKSKISKIFDCPIDRSLTYTFEDDDFSDLGNELHTMTRFCGYQSTFQHAAIMSLAWCTPGMPELILHDTLVLENFPKPPKSLKKCAHEKTQKTHAYIAENPKKPENKESDIKTSVLDESEESSEASSDASESCNSSDYGGDGGFCSSRPSYEWCFFLANMLRVTITYDCLISRWSFPMSSVWDGQSQMININDAAQSKLMPFGRLAVAKFVTLFCKSRISRDCGDAFCWGTNTMATYLQTYGSDKKIIRFLWTKNILDTVITEYLDSSTLGDSTNERIVENTCNILECLLRDASVLRMVLQEDLDRKAMMLHKIRAVFGNFCWVTDEEVMEKCTEKQKKARKYVFLLLNEVVLAILDIPSILNEKGDAPSQTNLIDEEGKIQMCNRKMRPLVVKIKDVFETDRNKNLVGHMKFSYDEGGLLKHLIRVIDVLELNIEGKLSKFKDRWSEHCEFNENLPTAFNYTLFLFEFACNVWINTDCRKPGDSYYNEPLI